MRVAVHGPFSTVRGIGADSVALAMALSDRVDVTVRDVDNLPPGPYPAKFRRLVSPSDADAHLVVGSPADPPPIPGAVVWAYPGMDGAPHDDWALVVATNRDAATDLGTDAVVSVGVDAAGFDPVVRSTGVLRIDGTWDHAARSTLIRRFQGSLVGTVADPEYARYAALFAATGGCLIGPPVDDLANLIHPDWAIPAFRDSFSEAVQGAIAHPDDTVARGRVAANYVRTALSWRASAERMTTLIARTL